jgi:hypothetical protein
MNPDSHVDKLVVPKQEMTDISGTILNLGALYRDITTFTDIAYVSLKQNIARRTPAFYAIDMRIQIAQVIDSNIMDPVTADNMAGAEGAQAVRIRTFKKWTARKILNNPADVVLFNQIR